MEFLSSCAQTLQPTIFSSTDSRLTGVGVVLPSLPPLPSVLLAGVLHLDQEELARRLRFGRRIVDDGKKETDGGDRQP